MAGLSAGLLDREVTIQQLSVAGSGYPTETWTELDSGVWMSKEDMRTSGFYAERVAAAQIAARYDTKWQLQWRDDMDPDVIDVPAKRRLLYRGRAYDIVQAAELGRQEGIVLYTITSPDQGEDA